DRMAVISPYGDRTFHELNAHANQLVRALRALGARSGETIALLCRNRPEFVEVYDAVLRSGLRLTPINWHLTADELAYIVDAGESNRSLVTGPLYHAAPLTISMTAPMAAGLGLVLMDGWSPEETLTLIERHGITHTHLVPIMFHRLLALPDAVRAAFDPSSLR